MSQPRSEKLARAEKSLTSPPEMGTETAAAAALDAAIALARDGNHLAARRICATVFFHTQPSVLARPDLLKATVHALLVTHAFRLLSRLVMSINGRRLDVTLLPERMGEVEEPRIRDEPRRIGMLIDPRWIDHLTPDNGFLTDWCDALSASMPGRTKSAGRRRDRETSTSLM
jgi:hypothetical protein